MANCGMTINVRRKSHRALSRDLRLGLRYRCFLNGKDVTNRTFYVDTRRKIIGMNIHNEKGQAFLNPDYTLAVEWIRGDDVRLVRRDIRR